MDDLIMFVGARLDEDEAAAKAAASVAGPDWTWKTEVPEGRGEPTDYVTSMTGALLLDTMGGIESEAPFVARHDPARVLREIAGARRILELSDDADWLDGALDEEVARTAKPGETTLGEEIRRVLAAVWCDHPDYRPAWKP